jgi:hypothetical protein
MIKTAVLIIMFTSGPVAYNTTDCDNHIRMVNDYFPTTDAYCLYPSYKMRPVARP